MKPVCVPCGLFFRMKKQGFYFEEGMPGPGAADRLVVKRDDDPPFDGTTRVLPGPLHGWQSYKLWVGDLWECRGCGAQILAGFGQGPLSEHYKPDYQATRERLGVTLRIDDC